MNVTIKSYILSLTVLFSLWLRTYPAYSAEHCNGLFSNNIYMLQLNDDNWNQLRNQLLTKDIPEELKSDLKQAKKDNSKLTVLGWLLQVKMQIDQFEYLNLTDIQLENFRSIETAYHQLSTPEISESDIESIVFNSLSKIK